jgi:flagella basal body P-ring formation protein FlgA
MLKLALWAAASALTPAPATVDTPVLARTVAKGETLQVSDFTSAPLSSASARGATRPDEASGQEALRRLSEGSPVRATDITTPRVVRRGEAVMIAVISGPLRITSAGRALSSAGVGEPVRVMNLSTNRTLDAVAEKAGHVQIIMQ